MYLGNTKRNTKSLYDKSLEKDACGVGIVADIKGHTQRKVVSLLLDALKNLEHRSATGADHLTNDGAGILVGIPTKFFEKTTKINFENPALNAVGMVFLPTDQNLRDACKKVVEEEVYSLGLDLLCWRKVPTNPDVLGSSAKESLPSISQFFVTKKSSAYEDIDFEKTIYICRKKIEKRAKEVVSKAKPKDAGAMFYICSFSKDTLVYKGMVMPNLISKFYLDLADTDFESHFGIVHSRFSTNTLGAWDLAHPLRYLAHNGEINTIRGNRNWMQARGNQFKPNNFGKLTFDIGDYCEKGGGVVDSATLDNVFELLRLAGREVEHVASMLIPSAWRGYKELDKEARDFFEYHSTFMEPWDGPAMVSFSDGKKLGATLDRNGLRPLRYSVNRDGIFVAGSETGIVPHKPQEIVELGSVEGGQMVLIDFEKGVLVKPKEVIKGLSKSKYTSWLDTQREVLSAKENDPKDELNDLDTLLERQVSFGYTKEDLKMVLAPMALESTQPLGSMGNDSPLAVMSEKPQLLPSYFKQFFAQVSNPPLDPIREKLFTQMAIPVGAKGNLFLEEKTHCNVVMVEHPIMLNSELDSLLKNFKSTLKTETLSTLFCANSGTKGFNEALKKLLIDAEKAVDSGCNLLVLSDRGVDKKHSYLPPLLATSAVHHKLIREGKRLKCDIVVETGEAREVHHFATLFGYGAAAINPYLAFESLAGIKVFEPKDAPEKLPDELASKKRYRKAAELGVLKTISKMGISTLQGYMGAQQFEAVGLNERFVDQFFTHTTTRIGGVGIERVAEDVLLNHKRAYPAANIPTSLKLDIGGFYFWRGTGETHAWNPDSIALLQEAVTNNNEQKYAEFEELCDDKTNPIFLRTLTKLKYKPTNEQIPLSEVEPTEKIITRLATGGISLGSISPEAHETMALAMNSIGARSNSGEGGEDPKRYSNTKKDSKSSAIKQVASGRFGVTSHYLNNATDIQIKMAQGAKPGEGGEIPGHKVDTYIASIRKTAPGVGLISPPPHHDIYSIEDLAQLIHDLKNSNPLARVHVKLVSEAGVGIIAAGVAKCKADVVLVSGHSGGTGASPLSSIKHAGIPWELGVSEAHQVLVANGLRDRIVVQTDGQIKTGLDLAIATLLGAEEWGIGTSALVTLGCIMLRKCHLNTCSVGIATRDPILRKKFSGTKEKLLNYCIFLVESLRRHMAKLGFRKVNDMVGRADMLEANNATYPGKIASLDLSKMLSFAKPIGTDHSYNFRKQEHGLDKALDKRLIELSKGAIFSGEQVLEKLPILNKNRSVGAMLSGEISKKHGEKGLKEGAIKFVFDGSAGLSFGAFLVSGVELEINGDTNDYLGKGMSGGRIVVKPFRNSKLSSQANVLTGNVSLYGATGGEVYVGGVAGQRFCVRNSGAKAVVEGVGAHCCEYMTGGVVVVLGKLGVNFGAGMSGGKAYIYQPKGPKGPKGLDALLDKINQTSVMATPLSTGQEQDKKVLFGCLQNHLMYTKSGLAKRILDDWSTEYKNFFAIVPKITPVVFDTQSTKEQGELQGV